MITQQEILKYIEKWSAQYSPINPVEPNEIDAAMKNLAAALKVQDFPNILDIIYNLKNEQLDIFMEFAYYYINHNAETLSFKLIDQLKPFGPHQLIDLIGFTQQNNLYDALINKIEYALLDFDSKISLIETFNLLKNRNAIDYLTNMKKIETNTTLLNNIDLVIRNLTKLCL